MKEVVVAARGSSLVPGWILEILFIYAFFWPEKFALWLKLIYVTFLR